MSITEGYDLSHLRVLVADPNKHMRHLLRNVLRSLGVRDIAEIAEGDSAYQHVLSGETDLILCESRMKHLDGFEFTKMVRTSRESTDQTVPIIMVTASTSLEAVAQARDCGVTEFLAKPVSVKRIYECIAQIIENPRPFVRATTYTGPCRRRHQKTQEDTPMRRSDDWSKMCRNVVAEAAATAVKVEKIADGANNDAIHALARQARAAAEDAAQMLMASTSAKDARVAKEKTEAAEASLKMAIEARKEAEAIQADLDLRLPAKAEDKQAATEEEPGALSQEQVAAMLERAEKS
ncbi:MAG: response regulator [Alphaproteobacteria bacterium]|nr:response regulator [Alphaproteobacteria bacterium]